MSVKDELRAAVEGLTDQEAGQVLATIRRVQIIAEWDAASPDDEEETEEGRRAVAQAKKELAAGRGIPWEQVRRRLPR